MANSLCKKEKTRGDARGQGGIRPGGGENEKLLVISIKEGRKPEERQSFEKAAELCLLESRERGARSRAG